MDGEIGYWVSNEFVNVIAIRIVLFFIIPNVELVNSASPPRLQRRLGAAPLDSMMPVAVVLSEINSDNILIP